MHPTTRLSLKCVFIWMSLIAAYAALVRAVGFENANGLLIFFAVLLTPVWVSFAYMYLELNPLQQRNQKQSN